MSDEVAEKYAAAGEKGVSGAGYEKVDCNTP